MHESKVWFDQGWQQTVTRQVIYLYFSSKLELQGMTKEKFLSTTLTTF